MILYVNEVEKILMLHDSTYPRQNYLTIRRKAGYPELYENLKN